MNYEVVSCYYYNHETRKWQPYHDFLDRGTLFRFDDETAPTLTFYEHFNMYDHILLLRIRLRRTHRAFSNALCGN